MPIDPWLMQKFELLRGIPSFEAAVSDPQYAPRFFGFLEDPEPWSPPADIAIEDRRVDGPHGEVPVRIVRPAEPAGPLPVLVWMHGGAFVFGSVNDPESMIPASGLARLTPAIVVSVDYRLAGNGVHYPVPLDDVLAAWSWVTTHVDELGADPDRLFLGGASAGGNLAASAAMRLRDEGRPVPRGLLLAYPLVHFPVPPLARGIIVEMEQLPEMLHFEPEFHTDTMSTYLGRVTDVPAGIAPGNFELHGMPETWLAPAEYDELRPSSELFAQQLEETGVPVHLQLAEGMIHGHLSRTPSLPAVRRTHEFFAAAMR